MNRAEGAAPRPPDWFIILLLGTLSVITPFAVDMYLPAFTQVARDFHTGTSTISLSLSTYFIGFALGQIVYGPLLDRFGRKRPLYVGLSIFVAASLGCAWAPNIQCFIAFRLLQALGGCAAQVGSVAMVRDFFPAEQSARIFSMLFLMIGVSPLAAPSVGSLLMSRLGWPWIFLLLAAVAGVTLVLMVWLLPEGHQPDPTVTLDPAHILAGFGTVLRRPEFTTYALAGAFSFAGLFAYVAGASLIFLDYFQVSTRAFGFIFAGTTMGFIGGSQLNVQLLRRFRSPQIFRGTLYAQVVIGVAFFAGYQLGWIGLYGMLGFFFPYLACTGIVYPNAAAIALRSFSRNVGSASALLGFIQMGVGSIVSTGIGLFGSSHMVAIISITSLVALAIFQLGPKAEENSAATAPLPPMGH